MGDTRATVTLAANLDPSGVLSAIKTMQGAFNNLKLPNNIGEGLDKSLSKATDLLKKYQSQLAKGIDTKTDAKNITKTGAQINEVLDNVNHYINELNGQQIFLKADVSGLNKLQTDIENARTAWKNAIQEFRKGSDIDKVLSGIGEKTTRSNLTQGSISKAKTLFDKGDLEGYKNALDEIYSRLKNLKDTTISNVTKNLGLDDAGSKATNLEQIKKQLDAISKINFSGDAKVKAQFDEITNSVSKYEAEIKRAGNAGQQAFNDINASSAVSNTRALVDATDQYTNSIMSAKDQVQDLQRSTQYFFSLRNMINLFKRGIDEAVQSVKELDAAMTETAVVTDYKVSDMWNMLPQYTQLANQLGATTQGAYETMTLYFQQGLDQQQAFELGAETMKMARIAGLDYAETTDMMTAALRGFNMELNETSAKRINDVYSELAAITASDTEELGTAMQRTASIAHSAGSSFEGTTAFLAQAIETTREPAENIGTAMKTIIARFQEMKKNPLEISEVEGEEVDYNKIDAALKTIGVDLKDTNGQFRDFDKVMLDISAKWDTLSQSQQRYIATTAAGSRQQSRFIAMVSNYDRTMQLMEAANNSAGASDEQFGKTMDSLESKLNKLHNAWQAFTMGIANNGMIKLAVDGITDLLTNVNKLIDVFSLGIGPVKSFLSIFTAFAGLKAIGKVANAAIGGLGGMIDPQSTFSIGFGRGFLGNKAAGNAQLASQINQPIVAELRALRNEQGQQFKQNQQNKNGVYDSYNQFKTANQQIRQLTGKNGYKTTQLRDILGSLDKGDQNKLMRHMSGTVASTRNSLMNYYQKQNPLAAQGIKQQFGYLNNQRKIGELSWKEYYDAISDPELLKRGLDTSTEAGKAAERMLTGMAAKVNQKVDSAVRSQALNNLSTNEDYNNSDRTNQQKTYQQEVKRLKADAEYMAKTRAGVLDDMLPEIKNSKWAKRVDSLGKVSAGITSAGMGIQSFGNLLISSANPALQAFGSTLVSVGGIVSNLGMGLGGLVSSFSAVAGSDLMGSIAKQIGIGAGALTAGLGVAAAAIAGIAWHFKKQRDEIRKDAEKITTDYKEKSEQHQSNISNLASYQEDFARLSAGVDANGMNVSLDTADYEHYLEITKAIASINPEIVDSYNAQGNAIISNKNALEETLAIEKERQSADFNNYIDSTSTEKLIAARNLSRQSRGKETFTSTLDPRGTISKNVPVLGYEFAPQAEMRKQAQKVGKNLQTGIEEGWVKEDILADFNIDIDDLVKGSNDAVQAFEQSYDQIKARVSNKMDSAGNELKDKTKESMLDAFSGYSEASDELNELITPLYEQQLARIGKSLELPNEFKSSFNQGLKEIVSDANITDVEGEIDKLTAAFSDLSSENSEYSKILKDITDAQDKYAETLNKADYDAAAQDAKERIEALKTSLGENMDLTQGYGKAISDFLDNEIAKIEDFTKAGAVNLQQALNTMTSEIEAAEGALENFNAIAEGSTYGKAASNMSQIFETATADEHILGQGDQAFWAGAEALVGRKNLLEGGGTNRDKALKQMKEVQEMLKGGQEGWDNFKIKWFDSADAKLFDKIDGLKLNDNGWISEIDESANPQVYDQIADALNMSKESLIAMLNLGRQFGEVDFTNVSDVRKALATSENTIKNSENGKVFVRKESLESDMTSAGIDLNKQQEIERDLQKNYNTELIKSADEISKTNNQFAEMGITSMESLVKTFDDTGQFTKDEIQAYAEKFAKINGEDFNQSQFDEYWQNNQDDTQFGGIPSSLDSIQSILSSIESILASQRLSEGYLDNPTADASKKWLFGGAGEDTAAQKFWKGHGSGANGEITASEFNQTSKELTDFIAKGKDYIDQLDKVKPANETERKQIEAEKEAYEYQVGRAETYLKEGTEAYNTQVQNKIDAINQDKEVVDKGFADLLGSITPESINTDAAQSTLNQLYEAAINNTPAVLTDGLMSQMQTLGIDIQKAIDAGLVIDKNGIFATAEQTGKETAEAGVEGNVSGQEGVDTTPAKTAGEQKGKETGKAGVSGNAAGQSSVPTPKPSTPSMPQSVLKAENYDSKVKVTTDIDENGLEQAKTLITEVQTLANQGATFTITTTGGQTLTSAANSAKTLTNSVGDKSVSVSAQVTGTETVTSLKTAIDNLTGKTVTVNIKHDGLSASGINSIKNAIDNLKDKTVTVTVNRKGDGPYTGGYITSGGVIYRARGGMAEHPGYPKKGTDRIPAYLTPGEYVQNRDAVNYFGIDFMRKINHKDLTGALQSFGSAAKGKYGRLGPNGKGGLTLTGEKGFEVAWIPSENRSMILGANGPQMTTLPADAIVWDHKQSKKILEQDVIPAGSHYVRGKDASDPRKTLKTSKKKKSKKTKKSKSSSSSKKSSSSSTKNINNFSMQEVIRFNIDKKITTLTNQIEKRTKSIEKTLSKIGTTYNDIVKNTKDQITALNAVKTNNQSIYDSYKAQLEEYRKQKEIVSYTTSGGKSKNKTINVSTYVNTDGSINYDAIKKLDSKALREAVFKQVSGVAKNLTDGMENAQKAIDDANQKIADLGKQMSETFYQWENELTEIYDLTQRINNETSLTSRFAAQVELEYSRLNAGFGNTAISIENIRKSLNRNNETLKDQITNQQQLIAARERELQAALSTADEAERVQKIQNNSSMDTATKAATLEWARGLQEAAEIGRSYVKNVFTDLDGHIEYTIDWEQFNKDRDTNPMTKDTYDKVKEYLDNLNEAATEFNSTIEEQSNTIKDLYDSLRDYQDYIGDFEDTLIDGVEELNKTETENAKRLSDSISNTLKDLLDEVKRRLDERRKQEDNRKTEQDISQKQQQLAALRANTAGGNQTQIAQLEKEIADAQQSYQRTLEDQLLDRLQQQGDEAQKQRERLIELSEAQFNIAASNNKELVDLWLKDPEAYRDNIYEAWMAANGYDDKGEVGQELLKESFESEFAHLVTAVEQTGFKEGIQGLQENTSTLITLLQSLENGEIGHTDELSRGIGALEDVTKRNTESLIVAIQNIGNDETNPIKLHEQGVDAGYLRLKGVKAEDLIGNNPNSPIYSASEMQKGGYSVSEMQKAGVTDLKTLYDAGYSLNALKNEGNYNASDFYKANISYANAKAAGFDDIALKEAGYTLPSENGITNTTTNLWQTIQDTFKTFSLDYTSGKVSPLGAAALAEAKKHKGAKVYIQGQDARVGASGEIYWDRKGTVRKWNPSTGQIYQFPYNQATYIKEASPKNSPYVYEEFAESLHTRKVKGYKTGGLATQTGPAWLDGTPAKPELVLNAQDTKNFIALKDILAHAMGSTNNINNSYGGNATYEININVDHINNDYDVDKITKRVKENIIKDSSYRNVTQVRKFR